MSWIEQRLAEKGEREQRNRVIAEHESAVYENLWEQVKLDLEEAQRRGIEVSTNGAPHDRTVSLAVALKPGEDFTRSKRLHIRLEKGPHLVKVSGGPVSVEFRIDVSSDGVVRLKHGDRQLSAEEAARMILDPFLFPELQ